MRNEELCIELTLCVLGSPVYLRQDVCAALPHNILCLMLCTKHKRLCRPCHDK